MIVSKKIKVGDTVEIQVGKLFQGAFAIVSMIININGGRTIYRVETVKGLVGHYSYKELKKALPCDLCDKFYTDKGYPVVDENYRTQKGLRSCGCNMEIPDGKESHT